MKPGANAKQPVTANFLSNPISARPMMNQSMIREVNHRIVIVTPTPFLNVLAPCRVARFPPVLVMICVLMETPVEIIAGTIIRINAKANEI